MNGQQKKNQIVFEITEQRMNTTEVELKATKEFEKKDQKAICDHFLEQKGGRFQVIRFAL